MPLEAISCTNCGSSDVQEVKPSTYFCNHCDTVFKHIDPTHVTVQREFCECGGAIAHQCRLCRTGICHGHDVWRIGDWDRVLGWIPTVHPVYRLPSPLPYGAGLPSATGYWVRPATEYFLSDAVDRSFVGGEVHLCASCLLSLLTDPSQPAGALIDEVAQAKVANRMCADPRCEATATCASDCCHLAWCSQHSSTNPRFVSDIGVASVRVKPVVWRPTGTICGGCQGHWRDEFRLICQNENSALPDGSSWSYVSKQKAAVRRAQRRVDTELPATLAGPCPSLTADGVTVWGDAIAAWGGAS